MNLTSKILTAISATEPSTFGELCQGLGSDKPDCKEDWYILFKTLESFEERGLVEIERMGDKIDTLILTSLGAERAREALRERS